MNRKSFHDYDALQRLPRGRLRGLRLIVLCLTLQLLVSSFLLLPTRASAQVEINFAQPSASHSVYASAQQVDKWRQGSWNIFHLQGGASLQQGNHILQSNEAILWVEENSGAGPVNMLLFLEGNVAIDIPGSGTIGTNQVNAANESAATTTDHLDNWFGRLRTQNGVQFNNFVREIAADNPPPIFERAAQRRQQEQNTINQVQYIESTTQADVISPLTGQVQSVTVPAPQQLDSSGNPVLIAPQNIPTVPQPVFIPQAQANSGGEMTTDVEFVTRSESGGGLQVLNGNNPNERVLIYTGGTRVNIDSQQLAQLDQFGQPKTSRLVIQADNIVAWESPIMRVDGVEDSRYEIYLEGNVVFAQGNRVVYADRMYYDTTYRRGTILNADVLTPVPSYQGLLRLKADVIQQLDDNRFQAFGAAITSSRLGVPRYWLQSDQVNFTRTPRQTFDPITGYPYFDPQTGQPVAGDQYFAESRDNRVYLAGIPIFYWPTLKTDLDNPSYYIERIRIGNDNIYGFQLGAGFDLYQLFGIRNRPARSKWIGDIDYLSNRGFGVGTELEYHNPSFFGIPGNTDGFLKAWFINDRGLDNLGADRLAVPLDQELRGRILARQRQTFAPGYQLRAEIGYLTDQNFLQQYFERDWDEGKDYTTGLWLERNIYNQSFNLLADVQVNKFFTQTEWLPRFDHYLIGQPAFGERAVWTAKSTIGYGQFRTAEAPTNAIDLAKFDPLAWEGVDRNGVVAGTRHELAFPVPIGAAKVVPYVLGDLSYWQEDLAGNDYLRAYGQAGVRASLPMWRIDPTINSTLFNLNGLAHKVIWDAEFLYADASQDLDRLPLYNQLDDDAQEFFRRRFAFDTFGLVAGQDIPLKYDERFFAFRSATQSNVTTHAMEIADDLAMVRAGMRNRWQTKRGLPGEARTVDWISFDIHGNFYPDANRDNFGADFGVVDYDFRWHLGDRFSLVSDGYFDFFGQGLRTASFGTHMSRPGVGNLYLGLRSIEGPLSSNVFTAALNYRMSDKWILNGSSSYDFGAAGNLGNTLGVTRIGESFLVNVGVNADISRDNVGFIFSVEPRFLPSGRLGWIGGGRIPPASSTYLE